MLKTPQIPLHSAHIRRAFKIGLMTAGNAHKSTVTGIDIGKLITHGNQIIPHLPILAKIHMPAQKPAPTVKQMPFCAFGHANAIGIAIAKSIPDHIEHIAHRWQMG